MGRFLTVGKSTSNKQSNFASKSKSRCFCRSPCLVNGFVKADNLAFFGNFLPSTFSSVLHVTLKITQEKNLLFWVDQLNGVFRGIIVIRPPIEFREKYLSTYLEAEIQYSNIRIYDNNLSRVDANIIGVF